MRSSGEMKKGQVSNELLVVVGFILLLFIPLMFVMYLKLADANADLSILQAHFSAVRIAYLVNAIGYMGQGSSIITEIYVSGNVREVSIGGNEVVIIAGLPSGDSAIVKPTSFGMEGMQKITSPGRYRLEIENIGDKVSVKMAESGITAP